MVDIDNHSRSRLAGYDPKVLFNANVLIVGAGALGQNLALDLALAGVGELSIVDLDVFEEHNATRSPLYPTLQERSIWGLEKAKVVAHKLLPMMTAPTPIIRYSVASIQSLGTLPIARAQVIFAAVDNSAARAYLAESCHIVRRPLIEAGFYGEVFNLSIFGPDADEPCYRCLSPEKTAAFSCSRYALQAEKVQAIPAIQNTAAVLAGLQAEAGIQWLHNNYSLRNKIIYGDIRRMSMSTVELKLSSACPGIHGRSINNSPIILKVSANDPIEFLLKAIEKEIGPATINLPDPIVMRNFCTNCGRVVDAHVPEWKWLALPLCSNCGGYFSLALENQFISSRTTINTDEYDEVLKLSCKELGLPAGACFEVWSHTHDEWYSMQIEGNIDQLMRAVS